MADDHQYVTCAADAEQAGTTPHTDRPCLGAAAPRLPAPAIVGKIVSWLKAPGDKVKKGESIVVS